MGDSSDSDDDLDSGRLTMTETQRRDFNKWLMNSGRNEESGDDIPTLVEDDSSDEGTGRTEDSESFQDESVLAKRTLL